jgi:hypothetical protein
MKDEAFLRTLRQEEASLCRRLEKLRELIEAFVTETKPETEANPADEIEPEPPPAIAIPPPSISEGLEPAQVAQLNNQFSETRRVIDAAAIYLRGRGPGARATSTEIYEALAKAGIEVGGNTAKQARDRVSSHLSSSDLFENARGQGYALRQ